MDTVEELNGTYFYAGKSNLIAAELLLMFFVKIQHANSALAQPILLQLFQDEIT